MILRPGKTPTGKEIRGHLRHLVRRIRTRWPTTRILVRGDGHYGRAQVMAWCEDNGIDYVFGLPGNPVLQRLVDAAADNIRTRRALEHRSALRGYAETRYKAKSWKAERRLCARIEATALGLDVRFVVTNLDSGSAEYLYDVIYCARSQAENLIKIIRASSPPTAPAAARRSPTRSARLAHRCILADAEPARCRAHSPSSRQSRVRHAAPQTPQARRPRRRNRLAHSPGEGGNHSICQATSGA
jgi:hypothetical protein